MFASFVRDTKITRLLLQDGFGARMDHACQAQDESIDAYQENARDYLACVKGAMPEGVQFWVDLEAFVKHKGDCDILQCRLDWQFLTVPPKTRVIAYRLKECRELGMCR
jgi:hypothetical protein